MDMLIDYANYDNPCEGEETHYESCMSLFSALTFYIIYVMPLPLTCALLVVRY